MVIGIDASRANVLAKTGTEWYSFFVIQELKKIIPSTVSVRLYSKEPLVGELAELPAHWQSRVLKWKPGMLWTQARLSIELLLHPVDILYVSAHTLPIIGGKKNVAVIHDVGFLRHTELYNTQDITKSVRSSFLKRVVRVLVRMATLGRYSASERDYHRFAFHFALRKASRIITISEFSKAEIQAVAPQYPSETISVIYNGFVERAHAQVKETVLQAHHISPPYILTLGRVEEKKNMLRCVEAFSILKKTYRWPGSLVCVGGFGFGSEKIIERVKELELQDSIHFLGWTEESEIDALFSQSAAFFFPTLYEGFGMPALEALHYRIPLVCSDIPPLHEVAQDSAVYCDPKNSEDMAEKLWATLSADPAIVATRAERGYERAREFSWERTARKTWDVITHV